MKGTLNVVLVGPMMMDQKSLPGWWTCGLVPYPNFFTGYGT